MIREEEDDMTQEIRQLVLAKTDEQISIFIAKIQDSKPPITDEWTVGLNVGMDWAVRILKKDKSAY